MKKSRLLGAVCACITLSSTNANATDKSWICGDGSWDNPACWSPVGQPMTGDNAFLIQSDGADREVSYRNAIAPSPELNSLTIDATGGGTMTMVQTQDTMSSRDQYIGYSGSGTYTQTGGRNSAEFFFLQSTTYLGYEATADGTYNLSGSAVFGGAFGSRLVIGFDGVGTFNQSGGVNQIDGGITLAQNAGSRGTYNLIDGSMRIGGGFDMASDEFLPVERGIAIFNQSGGGFGFSGNFNIGNSHGSGSATYNLSGGSATMDDLIIAGTGTVNQSGGTYFANDGVIINGGVYNLSSGNLGTFRGIILNGRFNQSGGTVNNSNESYGFQLGINPTSNGTYNLSDGILHQQISGSLRSEGYAIGVNGTGTFNQSGGTHILEESLILALNDGSKGTYNLSGGVLDATDIVVNSGGTINFTGGTLTVDNFTGDLVNNGGTLAPGDSPGITNIFGNYSQSIDSTFLVEVGGVGTGEFDVLDVTGEAALGGILDVDLFDLGGGLFNPTLGDSFDILLAETITGEFDILSLAGLGSGLLWDVSYILDDLGTDIVRLSVKAVPIPAAIWLFGSGLLGLVGIARRKKA